MYHSLVKVYKDKCVLISCNSPVFNKPTLKRSYNNSDVVQYRLVNEQVKRMFREHKLSSALLSDYEKGILYVRQKEKMKRLNFNVLNSTLVKDGSRNWDFSSTSDESIRKAKSRLRDIVLCNDWDYFCTLTFDPQKICRYSQSDIIPVFSKFFKNYFRRNCGSYIFVPERHEDGAFHFHGLISTNNRDNSIVPGVDVTTGNPAYDKFGKPIFNLLSWDYGHTYLSKVASGETWALKYILPYISKESRCFPRFYYSGGYLVRKPALVYLHEENVFDVLLDAGALRLKAEEDKNGLEFCCMELDDIPFSSLEEF